MNGMDEPIHLVAEPAKALEPADTSTFDEFVRAQHVRLFAAMCLVTGDRYEAEEVAQEAFVRVFERWNKVSAMEDPTGYLYRTAMNVFRKRYRRAALALRRTMHLAPARSGFEEVEDREVVVHALAQLPRDQRAALVVTALLGFNSEEAGRILGASPSTVRARATRARTALRERIGDQP